MQKTMRFQRENLPINTSNKKSMYYRKLFKRKYSTKYNKEVWVFNPFALLHLSEKSFTLLVKKQK